MLVHIERPSARVRYVINHVLGHMLGLEVTYAQSVEEFRSAAGPRLSYGTQRYEGAVHIPSTGAIDDLPDRDPEVHTLGGRPALFVVDGEEDLFAGIFYLLSLVDEIRCADRDQHGRVPSSALFSVRKGFADRPWVDERVLELRGLLERRWMGDVLSTVRYTNVVTVDMDNILRYAGRPLSRAVGATMKDLLRGELSAVTERWRVRSGGAADPFNSALDLVAMHRDKVVRAIFFFLMRGGTSFDHAADHAHPATRASCQHAATIGEVGIHPSYSSTQVQGMDVQERNALQRIIGKSVLSTRQHFLRWALPGTLRHLSDLPGDQQDHTLGFADRAGFRVGTCTPFPWYDLEREQETKVMLHPFAVMDSALIEQQRLGPDEVARKMNEMSDLVRAVSGQFVSVWHDRYLSGHREFKPWPGVFERVMNHAKP